MARAHAQGRQRKTHSAHWCCLHTAQSSHAAAAASCHPGRRLPYAVRKLPPKQTEKHTEPVRQLLTLFPLLVPRQHQHAAALVTHVAEALQLVDAGPHTLGGRHGLASLQVVEQRVGCCQDIFNGLLFLR